MQAQKASKTAQWVARIGRRNLIWGLIFAALMLTAALVWLLPYRHLPTASWRNADIDLPWETDSIIVEELRCHWQSSAGNERMELRASHYPVANIRLGEESRGSGMLYVRFTDSDGRPAGDTLYLYYENGNFKQREEVNIRAGGKEARVYVEEGFAVRARGKRRLNDFNLHCADEHSPLWRVTLSYRPEGAAKPLPLGFATIPAEEGGEEE